MANTTRITCPMCKGEGGKILNPILYEVCRLCNKAGDIVRCECTGSFRFFDPPGPDDTIAMAKCTECGRTVAIGTRDGHDRQCSAVYYKDLDGEELDRRECEEGRVTHFFYGQPRAR